MHSPEFTAPPPFTVHFLHVSKEDGFRIRRKPDAEPFLLIPEQSDTPLATNRKEYVSFLRSNGPESLAPFNEREHPPCAASPPPEGDHEKNGDAAEDIFPFFRRGSPFQPLLSSLTLDAYSGSETDPSEAFFGRRPRREDTGPSRNDPGSRPPSILNHGFFGVPWSKRCNMGAFR